MSECVDQKEPPHTNQNFGVMYGPRPLHVYRYREIGNCCTDLGIGHVPILVYCRDYFHEYWLKIQPISAKPNSRVIYSTLSFQPISPSCRPCCASVSLDTRNLAILRYPCVLETNLMNISLGTQPTRAKPRLMYRIWASILSDDVVSHRFVMFPTIPT